MVYTAWPALSEGIPAFGLIQTGKPDASLSRRQIWANDSGPAPQLAPIASTPSSTMARAAVSGVTPIMVRSLFLPLSNANETMMGSPVGFAACTARRASSTSLKVSKSSTSAPPSASASAWVLNASVTRCSSISPVAITFPVGPNEAKTRTPAADCCFDSSAPRRLIATTWSSWPWADSATGLPRKVLVRMTMLPASTYDRATASTSAGRVKFQTSAGSPSASPRLWNSVPPAPLGQTTVPQMVSSSIRAKKSRSFSGSKSGPSRIPLRLTTLFVPSLNATRMQESPQTSASTMRSIMFMSSVAEAQAARTWCPGRFGSSGSGRLACPRLQGLLRMLCAGLHILRHLGIAQLLVDRLRLLALALSSEDIGTAKQAFAYGNPIGLGRAREGFLQGGDGVERADPAQGPRCGLYDFGIRIVEPLDQRSNSLGISPHADAADDADQEPSLDLFQGVPQCGIHGRVGNRLQSVAGHVREFFIAEQGRQWGHRFPGANPSQLAAGVGLRLPGCVRLEDGDQLGLFVLG